MVEVPIEVIESLDRRAARIHVLILIMQYLVEEMKCEEQGRSWRFLWPVN
ncbi:hypothetical protein ES703_34627 [subsurface metagenome]